MTKDEILERYLNTVYFGNGAYGVQAAAEIYFGTDVERARLAAGRAAGRRSSATRRATTRSRDPEAAMERRDSRSTGWSTTGRLTEPSRPTSTSEAPLPTEPPASCRQPDDYFVEEVKQQLLDDRPARATTPTERYNAVFGGGLRIYTTFDPRGPVPRARPRATTSLPDDPPTSNADRHVPDSPTGPR